jgi:hypothetical protein
MSDEPRKGDGPIDLKALQSRWQAGEAELNRILSRIPLDQIALAARIEELGTELDRLASQLGPYPGAIGKDPKPAE